MQLTDVVEGLPPTRFYYWEDSYAKKHSGEVLRLLREDKRDVYLALDETIFHPKSGGQPSDRGTITGEDFKLQVKKSMLLGSHIILWGRILDGTPSIGPVLQEIDWEWRNLLMRRHTAAHLFDHCLSSARGGEVETTDSWLGDPCYAGYKGQTPSTEILGKAVELENDLVKKGLTVTTEVIPREILVERATRAPNLWRLPDLSEYRLVTIEGCMPIPCGGTHVRNASEISMFRIVRNEQLNDNFKVYFEVS